MTYTDDRQRTTNKTTLNYSDFFNNFILSASYYIILYYKHPIIF